MNLNQIKDHQTQALKRLITQYKGAALIEAIIRTGSNQIQGLETAFFDLLNQRALTTSSGQQLDRMGTILNLQRNGLSDDVYRIKLMNKVSQNISEGTPEDLINIYKILMQAESIQYLEIYPASVVMFAVNPNPIGEVSEIRLSLDSAKPAGVEVQALSSTAPFLVFDEDADGEGLSDITTPSLGGHLSEII
jgi:hypothetical protein